MVAGVMVMMVAVRMTRRVGLAMLALDQETPPDQHPVAMAHEAARHAVEQRTATQAFGQARLQVRQQVDNAGDEHVACQAADRVEMQVHARSHAAWKGMT